MRNIKELRESLTECYEKMLNSEMQLKQGKALANVAGKILTSVNIELKNCEMLDKKPNIEFLNTANQE
jgi:hypothetical protein